jgi:hypothetical protein
MEGIINTGILEEMHQIKLLAAIGLSKTKSEEGGFESLFYLNIPG